MSFVRPEATRALQRYGEPALYCLIGLWGLGQGVSLILRGNWSGWLLLILGVLAVLGLIGAARRAFMAWRNRRAGPGTVTIREGQIAYFGPIQGAIIALDALTAIDIRIGQDGDLFWILSDELGQKIEIPGGADGAVSLLDRLGSLNGFDHSRVMSAMRKQADSEWAIWRRKDQTSPSLS